MCCHCARSTAVLPEWVMSHIWRSHVTHMNESCHTYEWVKPHIWMSHVMDESYHTYEWVTSHIWMIWMSHVALQWAHWYCHCARWTAVSPELVMSHTWMNNVTYMIDSCHCTRLTDISLYSVVSLMSHVTRMDESWRGRVMSHIWMKHVTHMDEMNMSCHTYEWVIVPD